MIFMVIQNYVSIFHISNAHWNVTDPSPVYCCQSSQYDTCMSMREARQRELAVTTELVMRVNERTTTATLDEKPTTRGIAEP